MAEELSPESKLYVKEEIEKLSKEFKQELKEAQSRATKTFTAVALIIGILASVGILSLTKEYASRALDNTTMKSMLANAEAIETEIEFVFKKIVTNADEIVADLEGKQQKINVLVADTEKLVDFVEENFGYLNNLKNKELKPVYMFQQGNDYYSSPKEKTGPGWKKREDHLFYAYIEKTE